MFTVDEEMYHYREGNCLVKGILQSCCGVSAGSHQDCSALTQCCISQSSGLCVTEAPQSLNQLAELWSVVALEASCALSVVEQPFMLSPAVPIPDCQRH